MLQSVGVPVEVCRVKAKDGSEAADKLKRKNSRIKQEQRAPRKRGPSPIVVDDSSEEETQGADADEWQFESGDEGKGEGHWERTGKRAKR